MKTAWILIAALVLMAGTLPAMERAKHDESEEGKAQTRCPVMGGNINPKLYVDHEGYRVYVCCRGCLPKVRENPEKYIEQMRAEGVRIERVGGQDAR